MMNHETSQSLIHPNPIISVVRYFALIGLLFPGSCGPETMGNRDLRFKAASFLQVTKDRSAALPRKEIES
jgi:hypothetical protein